MRPVTSMLIVAALTISASLAAQAPPPTTPSTPSQPVVPLRPSQIPPNLAQVVYTNGTVSVSADNSSLNQILRQISIDTGMKITGGVADERVFGHYGPASPAQVLSSLLEGTAVNMVLVQRNDASLAELVLTPRGGGPTPPNPNAVARDQTPDPPRNFPQRNSFSEPPPPQQSNPVAPPVDPAATSTPAPASTQPDSPNGVKTPQQIYEQLQRMRQQQQQQQQTPPQ